MGHHNVEAFLNIWQTVLTLKTGPEGYSEWWHWKPLKDQGRQDACTIPSSPTKGYLQMQSMPPLYYIPVWNLSEKDSDNSFPSGLSGIANLPSFSLTLHKNLTNSSHLKVMPHNVKGIINAAL